MDDDWASPWADAGDRSPTKAIKNLDAQDAEDASRPKGNEPERQIPNSNVAVHTNDPWGGGEHGFGDASAWASSSPGIGAGEIPSIRGGPALPVWGEPALVKAPPFSVGKAKDEKGGSSNAIGITSQQAGRKTGEWFGNRDRGASSNLPITTDETEVWAAGSDWGDTKSEQAENFPSEGTSLSPKITPGNIPFPEFNVSIQGVNDDITIHPGSSKDLSVNATTLNNERAELKIETNSIEESSDSGKISVEDIPPILEPRSNVEDSIQERESEKEAEVLGKHNVDEEEPKGEEEEDFGDFVDEGDFEDAEEALPKDAPASAGELPSTPELRPDIIFDIQTSLVNKLYPVSTTYPKLPPVRELIYTTESRKVWYRLSQSGTIRRDKISDDDYVRVTWKGSKIQEGVNKIIVRWMTEDRNSGTGVALGGSRRLGAMFGWGESVENKEAPAQLRINSSIQSSAASPVHEAMKSPFDISTTTSHPAESEIVHSPQTASFGWSRTDRAQPTAESHPGSHATSSKGEDKPPSTPSRRSFCGTSGSSRMSSQPVTPSRSTKPHSPIGSNHSRQTSHSLVLTQPSSPSPQGIRRSAEIAKNTIPPTRIDGFHPAASRSTSPPDVATRFAPNSNLDEWGALENMATTVRPSFSKETNCNFDQCDSIGDTTKVINTKLSDGVLAQNQISGLSVGASSAEGEAITSKEDEWGAFEEPGITSKAASSDRLSKGLFAHAPMKLEERSDSKEKVDNLGSFEDLSTAKPSPHQQKIPSTNIPDDLHAKPAVCGNLFDAFEDPLTPKPPVSVPPTTNVVGESKSIPTEASGSKVQNTNNWSAFEAFESALTSKPLVSSQSLKMSPMQLADKPISKNQKIDDWCSFDAFEKLQPKVVSSFNLPIPSISNSAAVKPNIRHAPPPALSAPVVTGNDDDDWGEMVQSPQIPNGSSSFGFIMQPTSITPRTMSPAPPQSTQPRPQPQAVASAMPIHDFGSFETKMLVPASTSKPTNGGGTDTWDLSFFDGPISSNKTVLNVSASSSNQPNHDLWDAPVPTVEGRRLGAKELEEDKVVNNIVERLPDLSYMLL